MKKCQLNHVGSASSMETAAAVTIFSRSVEKYGLQYLNYYDDSSAFTAVENIYPNKKVKKYECLGHYQKKVGNRLRKGLGGKAKGKIILHQAKDGKFTDAAIDTLQNYIGIALRSGVTGVPELRNRLLEGSSMLHLPKAAKAW